MGVSTHSESKRLYIFSVQETGREFFDNEERHNLITEYLACVGIRFAELEGCYQGTKELSILVNADSISEDTIFKMAKNAKQECYFTLDNHKHGLYKVVNTTVPSGKKVRLGYMREVSKSLIDELRLDYSYRKDVQKYFTVWPTDTTVVSTFEDEVKFVKANGLSELARLKDTKSKIDSYRGVKNASVS